MTTDRTKFIGSSDIGSILGLNPRKTPLQVWAEKIGAIPPPDLSDNEAVEWGTRLERIVAQKFSEKHNVKLMAYKKRFVHSEFDFLTCELDSIICGTDELVEIKTTSLWNYRDWANPDDVPDYYAAQVMWELGISRRQVGHIAVLVGGQRYLEKKIIFDRNIFNSMVSKAIDFWTRFVVPKVMPDIITAEDSDTLYKLYPVVQAGQDIVLKDDANILIENIQAYTRDKIDLENKIDQAKNELKALLKENSQGHTNLWRITWKEVSAKEFSVPAKKYRKLQYSKIEKGD